MILHYKSASKSARKYNHPMLHTTSILCHGCIQSWRSSAHHGGCRRVWPFGWSGALPIWPWLVSPIISGTGEPLIWLSLYCPLSCWHMCEYSNTQTTWISESLLITHFKFINWEGNWANCNCQWMSRYIHKRAIKQLTYVIRIYASVVLKV